MGSEGFPREFHVGRSKLLHGSVIAGLLAILGLWLLLFAGASVPQGQLVGAINLVLAAGILFVAYRKAGDPRPHMTLDKDGVWYRDWGLDKIPWHQIQQAYSGGIRLNAFICLELRDPEAVLAGLPEEQRRKLRGNRLVRPPRLMIPNGALDAPLPEIVTAIRDGLQSSGVSDA